MTEGLTTLISTIGFPMAVCVYLLYERHTMIQKFIDAIEALRIEIIKLNERCNGDKKGEK